MAGRPLRTASTTAPIEEVRSAAYRIPTPEPEADGTLSWSATTMVVVQVRCGEVDGLGWTYADAACVDLIHGILADAVRGHEVLDVPARWHTMQRAIRNLGRPGVVSCALSAMDTALWDAAARIHGLPVSRLLGRVHDDVALYASGGFTTESEARLSEWLEKWVHSRGVPRVKIKIGESWGTALSRDLARIERTRQAVGAETEVYVDANGGYSVGQAVRIGARLADHDVTWFEEPVSSDDLDGLRTVRHAVTADVTAGEYGYDLAYFAHMIDSEAVDCVQVDVTRCGGYTEWARIAALATAHNLAVSAHCAPNLSVHAAMTTPNFRHIEWFADHDRIESAFFDGALEPSGGRVGADLSAPGHGMTFNHEAAQRHRIR
jgi:L-alanine-DL-glutamate epimerase-like enolase superfamily enzyme